MWSGGGIGRGVDGEEWLGGSGGAFLVDAACWSRVAARGLRGRGGWPDQGIFLMVPGAGRVDDSRVSSIDRERSHEDHHPPPDRAGA